LRERAGGPHGVRGQEAERVHPELGRCEEARGPRCEKGDRGLGCVVGQEVVTNEWWGKLGVLKK